MKTIGMWPRKSASSAECVTTHRSNRAASKMDGASIGRPTAGRRGQPLSARHVPRRVGRRRDALGRRRSSVAGAVACAYHGCSSLNFGRTRRAVVEKVSCRSSNETGSVAPEQTTKVVTQCPARGVLRKGSRRKFRHRVEPCRASNGVVASCCGPRRATYRRQRIRFEDAQHRIGVGSRPTLRHRCDGVGSPGDVAFDGEKGRKRCDLR